MTSARLRPLRDIITLVFTGIVLFAIAFPFLWVVVTSLRTQDTLFTDRFQLFPELPSLSSYRELLTSPFPRYLLNSAVVTVPATLITILLALMAAYAFSRRNFRFRNNLLILVLGSQLFPFVVLLTPLYIVFFRLGLVNNLFGLMLAYIAISLPYTIYTLVGYFNTIPRALDEAATIDGCSTLAVLFRIILPVAWPGVAAAGIQVFAQTWNEYLFALALMTNDAVKTAPVGLAGFFGEFSTRWDLVMTASVVATVPTLVFFVFAQRYLVSGLAAGAVKQ